MNKLKKIAIAIFGGIDAVMYMITPLILVVLWVNVSGLVNFSSYFFYGIGLVATIFRGIKIGWMK